MCWTKHLHNQVKDVYMSFNSIRYLRNFAVIVKLHPIIKCWHSSGVNVSFSFLLILELRFYIDCHPSYDIIIEFFFIVIKFNES